MVYWHQTGHLTAPRIVHVKSESDVSNVEHFCDVDNELFGGETGVIEHSAECSYLCDVCKKVFRSQKSLRVHKHIHSSQRRNSCDMCQKVVWMWRWCSVSKQVRLALSFSNIFQR
jgi:hypothetical protein